MNKKLVSTTIFFCLLLGVSMSVLAQTDDRDDFRDEMDGMFYENIFASLKSLSVSISFEDAPLLQGNFEKEIKTDVETKLRRSGFIINNESYPYLKINVKSIYSGNNISSFLIEIYYVEEFLLARDITIKNTEVIWDRKRSIRPNNIEKNTIRDTILNLVDRFTNICEKARNSAGKTSVPKAKEFPNQATSAQKQKKTVQEDSPFTETYVGKDLPPEVEVFNDSDRTLYLDLGKDKVIAYTILPGKSQKVRLFDGINSYKATALRVVPLQGTHNFQKGYRYTWRFTIIKR